MHIWRRAMSQKQSGNLPRISARLMTAILFRCEADIVREEKIIEMPIKTAEDVRRLILAQANNALSFKGLTSEDRSSISTWKAQLNLGCMLLESSDPDIQVAAKRLMLGAFQLGTLTAVTDSGKEYWRRVRCSEGGRKKDPATQAWKDWARAIIAKHLDVKAAPLTKSLLVERSRPPNLPDYDYLLKFVRSERKRIAG